MNEKLKEIIDNSKKSLYKISKETGLPYTTLNELYNEKLSVNKVMAESVYKLAVNLDVNISDILNTVSLMDGYSGKYNGYSFKWKQEDDGTSLYIKINDQFTKIHTEKAILIEGNANKKKQMITEVLLDAYDQEKKAEKELWEHII